MSNAATSWACNLEGLPAGAKLVLMLLSECHNGKTGRCDPSMEWLCKKTGYKSRMLANHLGELETRNLIERETVSRGRARGKKTDFVLNIGATGCSNAPEQIENNDTGNGHDEGELQLQQIAPALDCTCNAVPLQLHSSACALYKEEPEENRKPLCGKSALELIWPHWSSAGKKRSNSQALLTKKLNSMAKVVDLETVAKACTVYAKATASEYHKGLQVILNSGQWENWIGQDKSAPSPESLTLDDWKKAASAYCELQVWPRDGYGPAPHEMGCIAPAGLLRTIAGKMSGHRWHDRITENIPHKEQAA